MPLSLLLAASLLLHASPISHHSPSRISSLRCSRHGIVSPLPARAITAVKGDIQFALPVPSAASPIPAPKSLSPQAFSSPLMPLKAAFSLDTRAQEESEEQDLIAAINVERRERGLQPLTPDPLLTETARAHSREMCDLDYFDHHSPVVEEKTPLDRYLKSLHDWGEGQPATAIVGENLFFCSVTNTTYNMNYAHESLMNSPGHRANILEARFTKVGVGLYRDSQGRFWVTEMFLRDE